MREGFAKPVVVILTVLFIGGVAVTIPWFGYCAWYTWVYGTGATVAGRFDTLAVLRICAVLSAWVSLTSGLLWHHYKQEVSYASPLELFYSVCLGFFLFITMLSGVPALLGS